MDPPYNQAHVAVGGGPRRAKNMNENTFQKKLAELVAEIGTLPVDDREKLQVLAEETRERHQKLKQTVSNLHESIDFLRLSIKYLLFDLEATRRENVQMRTKFSKKETRAIQISNREGGRAQPRRQS